MPDVRLARIVEASRRAGGGSLSCTARGDCTLALTTEAGRPAAQLLRFSATEVGDQMILIEGQPAAYRLRY